MRRVLMVSPHFPPDTTAGAHRVRLLAPHLAAHGWEPTVVHLWRPQAAACPSFSYSVEESQDGTSWTDLVPAAPSTPTGEPAIL